MRKIYTTRGICKGNNLRRRYVLRAGAEDKDEMTSTLQFLVAGDTEQRVFEIEVIGKVEIGTKLTLEIKIDEIADVEERLDGK